MSLATAPYAPDPELRRRFGRYYTPPALVGAAHRLLAQALEEAGHSVAGSALVDPACGPGAFLDRPEAARYRRRLGLDLDLEALRSAESRLPGAKLIEGNAYGEGLSQLASELAGEGPIAVIGNPPYAGDSQLLKSGRYQDVRDRLLPFARGVPKGNSIRDDYVLFFGVADQLLEAGGGGGAIAFVTSASFVGNFLYAPMRRWLLSRYRLHALIELGDRLFEGTRVTTALSVWVRREGGRRGERFGHLRLAGTPEQRLASLAHPLPLAPSVPHGDALLLNAPGAGERKDLAAMRAAGDRPSEIFAVSFPGLKTRYDELLAAPTREALERRMRGFFASKSAEEALQRLGLPESTKGKLEAALAAREGIEFRPEALRLFARYAGVPHRFKVPAEAMGFAYLEPALIPRGDHRFRGRYDPHQAGPKLVFNVRELPLSSAVVEGDACVHAYRHSRFAPLWAPEEVVRSGLGAARKADLKRLVLNLSAPWEEAASLFERPEDLLHYLCAILNSRAVQERFAPWAGESEEAPVPRPGPEIHSAVVAIAAAARATPAGGALPPEIEEAIEQLYFDRAAGAAGRSSRVLCAW